MKTRQKFSKPNCTSETKKMTDIRIKRIDGVEFDEILDWTVNPAAGATIKYMLGDKERILSIESEAVEIEFANNV